MNIIELVAQLQYLEAIETFCIWFILISISGAFLFLVSLAIFNHYQLKFCVQNFIAIQVNEYISKNPSALIKKEHIQNIEQIIEKVLNSTKDILIRTQ